MLSVTRQGNPAFSSGRPVSIGPATPTEFDERMRQLGLTSDSCASSTELQRWCEENRNRCYVPEWLLSEWGIKVEPGNS
jgi:hypothetical protein